MDSLVNMSVSDRPPEGHESRHLWADGGVTWQSNGAVSALECGAVGDGVTDDWKALQSAVDSFDTVVLPKGFYRLSRPLLLRRKGAALVGVGRTISFLMPVSDPPADSPFAALSSAPAREAVLDVVADGVTVSHLTIATWDHLPCRALHWRGAAGTWRQSFFNRLTEATFPPFSAPGAGLLHHIPHKTGTRFGVALSVISGGGAFYDFNLDFGCCFGTVLPRPPIVAPPDTSSSGEILLQDPDYRTVLVNDSTAGVRFYQLNAEQDFGEAHTEIRYSRNVTMYLLRIYMP